MARSEVQAFWRHQVHEWIVQGRHRGMNRRDNVLILVRSCDGQHARVRREDSILLDSEASRDHNAPVLGHGFANGVQALLLRRV